MKIKKICKQCGKEFEVYPHRKDEAKICSKKCLKRENRTCKICGKEYIIIPSSKRQTCGDRKCTNKLISRRIKRSILISCDYCGSKVEKSPSHVKNNKWSFCNHNCYGKWIKEKKKKAGTRSECKQCGKKIYKYPFQIRRKINFYCSKKCFIKYVKKNVIPIEIKKAMKNLNVNYEFVKKYNFMPILELQILKKKLKEEIRHAKNN